MPRKVPVDCSSRCQTKRAEKVADAVVEHYGQMAGTFLGHLAAAIGIWQGSRATRKAGKPGASEAENAVEAGSHKMTAIKVIAELSDFIADMRGTFGKDGSTNNISLTADHAISLDANNSVKISGSKVGMNGVKSASLTGTMKASVTGFMEAGMVGGINATVKALAKTLSLFSDNGKVLISGKDDVLLNSEDKKVMVTGNEDVQVNSREGHLYLSGVKGVNLATGTADGFGMLFNPGQGIFVGQMSNCHEFHELETKFPDAYISVTNQQIFLQSKRDLHLQMNNDQIKLTAPTVNIVAKSGNVELKGDKVLVC